MSDLQPPPPQVQHPPAPPKNSREDSEIPSDQLLCGSREVRIRHEGQVYRLRLTRNGKLILHK